MTTEKQVIRKSYEDTINVTISAIKREIGLGNTESAKELSEFLSDYGKDMGSLLYCYEFITESEVDAVIKRVEKIHHLFGRPAGV